MKLEYAIAAAEEFGDRLRTKRDVLEIDGLMIFGSAARGKKEPKDIDLLLIHNSEVLQEFQEEYQDRNDLRDTEKLMALGRLLGKKGVDLFEIVSGTRAMELIEGGLFNLGYMGKRFFTDPAYNLQWNARNIGVHGEKEEVVNFAENIFREGKLFNWETGRYDLQASGKYNPTIN